MEPAPPVNMIISDTFPIGSNCPGVGALQRG
ncbi:hypothetical protein ACVWY3_004167 [Bradyrhizobium sp. USDA 4486]